MVLILTLLGCIPAPSWAFGPDLTATQLGEPLTLVPATQAPPAASAAVITRTETHREIRANTLPNHNVGAFPNPGNPHTITAIDKVYRVPLSPVYTGFPQEVHGNEFGVALNGVPFDPGTGEFYNHQRGTPWRYEALSGQPNLGLDASHAHVQPNGKYHYHGLPSGLLTQVGGNSTRHSGLVGYAADGFPIYAIWGYADPSAPESGVQALAPSWRLKSTPRPAINGGPGGTPDGTFEWDYEYVEGAGDLDRCNGRETVTPEYPQGTYAYFLTEAWPVVPRCHMGETDPSFAKHHGPPGRRGQGRPPHPPRGQGGHRGPPPR